MASTKWLARNGLEVNPPSLCRSHREGHSSSPGRHMSTFWAHAHTPRKPTSTTCIPSRRATCTAVVNFPIPREPLRSMVIGMSNVRACGISAAWDNPSSCVKARWLHRPTPSVPSTSEPSVPLGSLCGRLGLGFRTRREQGQHTQEGPSVRYPSVLEASLRHPSHRRVHPTAQFAG